MMDPLFMRHLSNRSATRADRYPRLGDSVSFGTSIPNSHQYQRGTYTSAIDGVSQRSYGGTGKVGGRIDISLLPHNGPTARAKAQFQSTAGSICPADKPS